MCWKRLTFGWAFFRLPEIKSRWTGLEPARAGRAPLLCTPELTNRCRPYSTLPPRRFLFSFTVYQRNQFHLTLSHWGTPQRDDRHFRNTRNVWVCDCGMLVELINPLEPNVTQEREMYE